MATSNHAAARTVREFVGQQLPIIAALIVAGFVAAFWEYGYIPGGQRPFPLAGVRVPIWHLIWMGVWTGYTMALVGQAAAGSRKSRGLSHHVGRCARFVRAATVLSRAAR